MSVRRPTFLTCLLALACAACSTPRVKPPQDLPPPPIIAAHGALAEKAAERVVDNRLGADEDDEPTRAMVDAFREQAGASLVAGNKVSLLVDGPQTLAAIRKAIEGARHHVHIETYIFADDEVGRDFRELLIRKRSEGATIRVMYDAVGSVTTPGAFFDEMVKAGIEVRQFRPLDPVRTPLPWKINNRDHRKITIVDGRVAFTGGINISAAYASASTVRPGPEAGVDQAWRDTHVQIEGPVVTQFQTLFFGVWTRAGGEVKKIDPEYFPTLAAAGSELVAVVATEGGSSKATTIYATYLATIRHASKRIWITQAYFAPNKELRDALIAAAARGIDVRLIVPGFTDSGLIFYASRASYDELLKGGVRIYEQRYALLHAKTAVIDGALSMVGSANLDMRSFVHNNEVNAVIVGSDFASRLEKLFERDLNDTHALQLADWKHRPFVERFKEWGSSLFSYWL
jgi:cardiolipin synthase